MATVTNLSLKKRKRKRIKGEAWYFIVEVPSQKIAYLDNNSMVSTLAKDQRWQSETHYKTMADCLPAWLLGWLSGAVELPCCYLSQERKETHIIIISLFITVNTGVNDWSQRA